MNVDQLKSSEVINELKKFDAYHGKTNKEIINLLGSSSVYVLRPALKQLLTQSEKPETTFDDIYSILLKTLIHELTPQELFTFHQSNKHFSQLFDDYLINNIDDIDKLVILYHFLFHKVMLMTNNQYQNDIHNILLNIMLILTKARTAYIMDTQNKKVEDILVPLLLKYFNHLTIIKSGEPMIYLKENDNLVQHEYTKGPMGRATLLGYCYNNIDFMNLTIDRLSVSPVAVNDQLSIELYITVIPQYAYKDNVLQCLEDQVALFDSILNHFGFHVKLEKRLIQGNKKANNYHYEQYVKSQK